VSDRKAVLSRRRLVRLFGAAPAALLLAACGGAAAPTATAPPAAPTATAVSAAAAAPASAASATSQPATATSLPATPTPPPATATTAPATATGVPTATTPPKPAAATATSAPAKPAAAAGQVLAATPTCADDDDLTPAQTEGPYYSPNTPERASLLEPGMGGTRLLLTGRVLSTGCQPVARALIDFWQADDRGQYDNRGFKLRGHQFSDAQGGWRLETIVPGLYTGRTRHIHVKVQAPNRPVLTTQLYFPNEAGNARDGIFNRELVMAVRDTSGGQEATFDFVLNVG
jgi:protocatechuate 3,4-dioxygenase beta subunit